MERLSDEKLVEMDNDELLEYIITCHEEIDNLQQRLESVSNGNGRKQQVLEILQEGEAVSIITIAERLGISAKNVSSQLTYLRQEGINVCTDTNGKKFIM